MTHKTAIFVHCLATPPGWMDGASAEEKRDEVRRWHVDQNGWADIAYAAIIDRDGAKAWGRDIDGDGDYYGETAAAARGFNKSGIHIALVGGHGSSEDDAFSDHYTPAQDRALREEIARIREWAGKDLPVRGHNEVAPKACPGFNVKRWHAGKPAKGPLAGRLPEVSGSFASMAAGASGVAAAVGRLDPVMQWGFLALAAVALVAAIWIFAPGLRRRFS